MSRIPLDVPVTFTALEWQEPGWKSGHPVIVLEPLLRYFEESDIETALEETILDAAFDLEAGQEPQGEDLTGQCQWRGWNLPYLRRVAREVRKGREYPLRAYGVEQRTVRFVERPAPDRVLGREVDIVDVEEE